MQDSHIQQIIGGTVGQAFSYAYSAVVQHKPLGAGQARRVNGREKRVDEYRTWHDRHDRP